MAKNKKDIESKSVNSAKSTLSKPSLDDVLEFAEGVTGSGEMEPPVDEVVPAIKNVTQSAVAIDKMAGEAAPVTARSLMPSSEKERQILRQRALAMAQAIEKEEYSDHREEYLRFRLGDREEYGIPYEFLDEILHTTTVARVPCTPAHIAGVVNRRGEMLTVIDLQPFFKTRKTELTGDERIIVVSGDEMRIGILVDEVISNDRYIREQLAPSLVSDGVTNIDYVKGIYNGKVTILNMDILLSGSTLRIDEVV